MYSIPNARWTRSARRSLSAVAVAIVATVATVATASYATTSDPTFPASVKLEKENYVVEISAPGPFKVGVEGTAKITLTTKGDYHINPEYPYRFKAAAAANGLSYPKPVLQRADGKFEEKKAVFNLPFVASQAGKFNVGGTFSLSVCSTGNCLVEKAPLDVTLSVQ